MKHITPNIVETKRLAEKLTEDSIKKERKGALVFALVGELGAGKTTFTQGVAEYFGIERNVTSPTFVLMKTYDIKRKGFNRMYHIDCYRLGKAEEILDLDWNKIVEDKNNMVLVEWAEKIEKIIPTDAVWVKMYNRGGDKREIIYDETND